MKRVFSIEVGPIILVLAFFISLSPFGTGVLFTLGDNIVDILVADPNQHLMQMLWAFFFLILPPLAGLIFSIIAYVSEMKSPTGKLEANWIPLTALGVFFFLWGFNGYRWTNAVYPSDIDKAINFYHSTQAATLVSDIYMAVSTSFLLWVSAGILLMTSPILKIILKTKRKKSEQVK